ncbi:MAG: phosphatase PAP2 family protein [Roseiarcus sp.]
MRKSLVVLVGLTLATLAVFALWPQIDGEVSRAFYGPAGFIGRTPPERAARDFFRVFPFVVLAAFAVLYFMRRYGFVVPYAPTGRGLAFIIATMAIGPGLIVNLGLKDHAHRPRPVQTEEFGGKFEFRPWYRFDGECRKNCSFVSGEVAEAFWMVAPASLAPPPLRTPAVGAALAFGFLTALLRIAYGGHFLSDALLAALLMLIIVQGTRWLLYGERDAA